MKANFTKALFTVLFALGLVFQTNAATTAAADEPVIDLAAATFYIAPCEESADFIYSALITDPDGVIDNIVTGGVLGGFLTSTESEDRGDNAKYFEFTFVGVPEGAHTFTISYQDLDDQGAPSTQLRS
ncbi:MAG: hypothetical protein AAFO07_28710, partial [Bacteroidota bacterium]